MQVSDLDFKKLRVMIHRLKGSISGEHPLQPDEAQMLKAWLKARGSDSRILFISRCNLPISRIMLHVLMRHYGQQAGLPEDKRDFHVLKHSIATHLLAATDDVRFVQDWLGHSNTQNTILYTYLTSRSREEKARKAFLKLPRF